MAGLQGWQVAGKSWTAFGGTALASLLPLIAQIAGVMPPPWGAILTGVGGLISLIAGRVAYSAPYRPVAQSGPTSNTNPWPQ